MGVSGPGSYGGCLSLRLPRLDVGLHLDRPGQRPWQKGTLTASLVKQSPSRRTVVLVWTWQEPAGREGGRVACLRTSTFGGPRPPEPSSR